MTAEAIPSPSQVAEFSSGCTFGFMLIITLCIVVMAFHVVSLVRRANRVLDLQEKKARMDLGLKDGERMAIVKDNEDVKFSVRKGYATKIVKM
jgi:hypothetical protein